MGIDEHQWDICDISKVKENWPNVVFWICDNSDSKSNDKLFLKFDLTNYPENAPTACPWDFTMSKILEPNKWPKGNKQISTIFNPGWKPNGVYALYAPCDRIAIAGHDQWKLVHPDLYWKPTFTIVKYLNFVFELLNPNMGK